MPRRWRVVGQVRISLGDVARDRQDACPTKRVEIKEDRQECLSHKEVK
jgi:hypothetical protein